MTILNRDQALVQHICTVKDTNGNPRRLWLVTTTEGTVALDEGYVGTQIAYQYIMRVLKLTPDVIERHIIGLPTIEVKPSEYKRLLKDYKVEDSNE